MNVTGHCRSIALADAVPEVDRRPRLLSASEAILTYALVSRKGSL